MTPTGKKHKDVARQDKEGDLPTTPLFHFPDDNNWQVVAPKNEKKKGNKGPKPLATVSKTQTIEKQGTTNKPRWPRTEAVLVKPAEGKTYADVLQKIKDAVNYPQPRPC